MRATCRSHSVYTDVTQTHARPPLPRPLLLGGAAALLALTGCASHRYYYAAAPQPVYAAPPPLVQVADGNGYRDGQADGARDVYQRQQYRPTANRRYARTPGYEGRLVRTRCIAKTIGRPTCKGMTMGFAGRRDRSKLTMRGAGQHCGPGREGAQP